jgi:hypothetical protein
MNYYLESSMYTEDSKDALANLHLNHGEPGFLLINTPKYILAGNPSQEVYNNNFKKVTEWFATLPAQIKKSPKVRKFYSLEGMTSRSHRFSNLSLKDLKKFCRSQRSCRTRISRPLCRKHFDQLLLM